MKNYKPVWVFAAVWGFIVLLGLIFTPEKSGFTERPINTLLWLLVYPIGGAFVLVWLFTAIRKKWNANKIKRQ